MLKYSLVIILSLLITSTTFSHEAYIEQVGSNNKATQEQTNYHDAYIYQMGGSNTATQTQTGYNNYAYIEQGTEIHLNFVMGLLQENREIHRTQESKLNTANQVQSGTNNKAYSYQMGIKNNSDQTQKTGNYNEAYVIQEGRYNQATQTQFPGSYSRIYLAQIGDHNVSSQSQYTDDNYAESYQIGIGNYLTQEQGIFGGSGYYSQIYTKGNYNEVYIYQY
ncbi:MAG: hypothetical protein ACPLSJ_05700 [Thermosulfidibacteraceae bacterium]